MPALITHHLFGEHASAALPDGIIGTQEELLAFLLGNQGPDPFFFRFRTLPENVSSCQRMAHVMHNELMTKAFGCLHDSVEHLTPADSGIGRAFALGIASHYVLDRTTHPFIFAEEYATLDASDQLDLEHAGGEVHAIIEGEIDSWMLWRERHATVLDCPPARELTRTPRIERVAGALMAQVAWQVFGIELGADEYGHAAGDMEFGYRAIEPAGSGRARAIGMIERLVRDHSQIESMAHLVTTDDHCRFANEAHHEWANPWTGEASTAGFDDLFGLALDVWPSVCEAFVEGGDAIASAVAHINYSGRTLDADELWVGEE